MSRYYIYDSLTDSIAEFATSYSADGRKSSRYRGKEGGQRPRPKGQGLGSAEVRVTGSGQNPIGRAMRSATKGGGLTGYNPGFAGDQANSQAFKKMLTKKGKGKLLLAGGALAAGGALTGGAYLANRSKKRKAAEAEKRTIKGRIKSLLGR